MIFLLTMNRDSNTYTIIYAAIMVVVVAVALTLTAGALRKPQQENERIDKMQQILRAVQLEPSKDQVISTYAEVIKQEILVNGQGNVIATFERDQIAKNEAFQMNTANQFKSRLQDPSLGLPVYIAEVKGQKVYIFPMDGTGLWGAIWGYLAVQADGSTVYGTDFSHADETPGLGAEIATKHFSQEFVGKHLYRGLQFKSIAVVKRGKTVDDQDYVDGISGGTLTSNGVNSMLWSSIHEYLPYIEQIRSHQTVAE